MTTINQQKVKTNLSNLLLWEIFSHTTKEKLIQRANEYSTEKVVATYLSLLYDLEVNN
jgi:hypothetical protein